MSKSTMAPGPITLDVVGFELTAEDRRRILHPLTEGVILFGRNFSNRQQLTKLTAAIRKLRPDVLLSIDHEGGRVQRCKVDGFPIYRPCASLVTCGSRRIHHHILQNRLLLRWLLRPLVGYMCS